MGVLPPLTSRGENGSAPGTECRLRRCALTEELRSRVAGERRRFVQRERGCYAAAVFGRRRHDEFAQQALAYADSLHNFARYLARDGAEDLVQETYARALAAAPRFAAGTDMKAYLFRILRNLFLDQVRRGRHEPEPPEPEPDLLRDDAELDLLRGVVAADIELALRQLSPDSRTAVLLDLEGMTEAEVAEVMGCAQGTVKSRLSRARAQLRKSLRAYQRS